MRMPAGPDGRPGKAEGLRAWPEERVVRGGGLGKVAVWGWLPTV